MEVSDVLKRLRHLGLEVRQETGSGHYKIHDPKTGAWLFNVSSSPSDRNWHYNIARHLRRIGLSLHSEKKQQRGHKRHSAVDLVALKKAQDQARAAGLREPQLTDLDTALPTSQFWKRKGTQGLVEAAQTEVIDNMVIRAESARVDLIRGRLENLLIEKEQKLKESAKKHGRGFSVRREFARIAVEEVAPQRGMETWDTVANAEQAISRLLSGQGLRIWGLNMIDSTIDHINGLRWGVIEPQSIDVDKEPEPEPMLPIEVQLDEKPTLKERYASALLGMLEKHEGLSTEEMELIMGRLDKLVL